jgi:hypothetical protein
MLFKLSYIIFLLFCLNVYAQNQCAKEGEKCGSDANGLNCCSPMTCAMNEYAEYVCWSPA